MDWFRNVPNVIRNQSVNSVHQNNREVTYGKIEDNSMSKNNLDENNSISRTMVAHSLSREDYIPANPVPHVAPARKNSNREEKCALCGEVYSDPRLLPCLHSFCRRCLEHTVNPRSTTLTCHLCRMEISLKIDGISEFPTNFVINNLIDVEAVRSSGSKSMLCSSCNEKLPATARCLDCMEFLCYACHSAHNRVRMTKDHQVLSLEQLKRSDDLSSLIHRQVFCPSHQNEKVTYYCNTCQQTICRDCVISSHQQNQHDYTLIENAVDAQREDIRSLKEQIDHKLPMLNRAMTILNETEKKLDSRVAYIQSEIEDHTPKLIKLIEEKENAMLRELNQILEEKKSILSKQMEQLQTEYNKLESTKRFAGSVISTGTNAEILSVKSIICDKIRTSVQMGQSFDPEVDDQISCDTNIDNITNAIGKYGKISTCGEEFLKCIVFGEMSTVIKGQTSQVNLVVKNQYDVETPCPKADIDAEINTPDHGVLIPEIRQKSSSTFVLVYRTYSLGIHKLSIKLRGQHIFGSPFSLNVISTTEHRERRSSETSSHLQRRHKSDLKLKPPSQGSSRSSSPSQNDSLSPLSPAEFSISPSHDAKELDDSMGTSGSPVPNQSPVEDERNTNIFREYGKERENIPMKEETQDLDTARKISCDVENRKAKFLFSIGRRGTQNEEFHGVFGLCSDHKNKRIIATDCHNNRIQVFDENGSFLFTFGKKGNNDGEFQSPTGVAVGPNSEIVICERLKGRIQVFNSKGVFQRRFILNQLKASTLTVDITGRIIIADYTNCCIYILDPILERWSKFGHFGQSEGELQYPCYVASDSVGNIYVSDMNSNKVQMYDSDSMFIKGFGSRGEKNGEFLHPTGIAVDMKSRIIVADRDNHRIQILSSTGEFISKFGSKCEEDGELSDAHGIAVLSNGNVAVADLKNNRILVFSTPN